jgi:CubicO group peptidase (beta-lactamase class C family)
MKKIIVVSLCLFWAMTSLAQKKQEQSYAKQIQEFDKYIDTGMKQWQVTGLSVVVVKDGKVIFKKGYGNKELGKINPVDTRTLFSCGSTTKAMTATCMGMLVDEGKVNWNDPVVKYVPDFQLYDPFVTRELKIRDLFIHDSGVGNADFLWGSMNISSDEILKKMSLVKPSYSLRSSFIYQNIFYLVAGKVIEKVSGQPWDDFIRKRIFTPLSMNRTVPMLKYVKDANQTRPMMKVNGTMTVIEDMSPDAIAPAGAVWSCADDISQWVLCMLDSSKYSGGRLLQPATWTEMFKPQTIVPESQFYPTMQLIKPNWTTYGLAWFQHDYKGKKINYHTGSLPGATAINAQLPDENMGIYVFGNTDHAELRHALVYKAFDLFALGGNRDWSSDFLKLYTDIQQKGEKVQKDFEANHVANTSPSLPLQDYSGKYTDPLCGEVEVSVTDKSLTFNLNNVVKATLPHWHFDTFYGTHDKGWFGKASAVFSLSASGKVEKLNFDGMEFKKAN